MAKTSSKPTPNAPSTTTTPADRPPAGNFGVGTLGRVFDGSKNEPDGPGVFERAAIVARVDPDGRLDLCIFDPEAGMRFAHDVVPESFEALTGNWSADASVEALAASLRTVAEGNRELGERLADAEELITQLSGATNEAVADLRTRMRRLEGEAEPQPSGAAKDDKVQAGGKGKG